MTAHGDRRKHVRLNVPLAVTMTELESDHSYYEETACCNVSTGGLFLVTSNHHGLDLGRRLAVAITLPAHDDALKPSGRIYWQGEVVRLERKGLRVDGAGPMGVALRFLNGFRLSFSVTR